MIRMLLASALILALSSCSEVTNEPADTGAGNYVTDTARVDYKNSNSVIFYDFSSKTAVTRAASDWDLAVNLTDMMALGLVVANSGDYGIGVRVLATGDTAFATDFSAMFTDSAEQFSFTTKTINPIGQSWFDYNPTTHVVTPTKEVYLVQNGTEQFKVQFTDISQYGVLTMNIASPDGAATAPTVIAPVMGYEFAYIDLGTGAAVDFAPADSAWDVKFCRTEEDVSTPQVTYIAGRSSIVINSQGGVTAATAEGKGIKSVSSIAGLEFSNDKYAIGHSWYDVDQSVISEPVYTVPANTFVITDTEGGYFKFEMNNFFGPESDQQFYSEFVYLAGDSEGGFAE